jgi:putative transposase
VSSHRRDCSGYKGLTKESPADHQEYKEIGQEPVLGEEVGRPREPCSEKVAEVIRAAYSRYRYGARMPEMVIRKQFKICISHNRIYMYLKAEGLAQ